MIQMSALVSYSFKSFDNLDFSIHGRESNFVFYKMHTKKPFENTMLLVIQNLSVVNGTYLKNVPTSLKPIDSHK